MTSLKLRHQSRYGFRWIVRDGKVDLEKVVDLAFSFADTVCTPRIPAVDGNERICKLAAAIFTVKDVLFARLFEHLAWFEFVLG